MDNDPDAPKLEDLADDELLALAFERGISVRGAHSVSVIQRILVAKYSSSESTESREVESEANKAKYRVCGWLNSLE